ncbi:MAG: SxtJ family membrane protein [Ignavibacteriae bacterium]|nr:SxtJ family membrane protein [Ignavibacteriota bacterium]
MTVKQFGSMLYRWWMKFAYVLAIVNTTILLTLVYILLIGPFSLVTRLFGKDLLKHRLLKSGSFWMPKEPVQNSLEESRRQF